MVIGLKITGMKMGEMLSSLRDQGKAILIMVSVAVLSVLGMVVLSQFKSSVPGATATVNATIDLFIAAFALVGTFASVTMLIIVVKAVIGIVKGLKG